MFRFLTSLVLAVAAITTAAAAPPSKQPATVIHAGNLLDRPGTPPRGPSTIVIRNGRIESVSDGIAKAEAGATVIDLRNRFVLPGLIDSHVHLDSDNAGNEAQLLVRDPVRPREAPTKPPTTRARRSRPASPRVRNLGDRYGVTLALRDAIADGQDRRAPHPRRRHVDLRHRRPHGPHARLPRRTRRRARRAREPVRRPRVLPPRRAQADPPRRRRHQDRHHRRREQPHRRRASAARCSTTRSRPSSTPPTSTARRSPSTPTAPTASRWRSAPGADSIEHGTLMNEEEARLFVRAGAYYVPTLSTVNGYIERLKRDPNAYTPEVRAKNRMAHRDHRQGVPRSPTDRGVKIAFGTDCRRLAARPQRRRVRTDGQARHDARRGARRRHRRRRRPAGPLRSRSARSSPASAPT